MQTRAVVKWNRTWSGIAATLCALFSLLTGVAAAAGSAARPIPPVGEISEQTVFFYYQDLTAPRRFYGEILGLEPTFEDEWVSIYRVAPGAQVGVVREGGTAQHKAQPQNAVMLSIVTSEAATWNERLKAYPDVKFLKELYDHEKVPIRALLVADPGGYTVEIFQWLKK